jgi:hypothetical protein
LADLPQSAAAKAQGSLEVLTMIRLLVDLVAVGLIIITQAPAEL